MIERKEVLNNLILFKNPIDETLRDLSKFNWDSEEELITLTVRDLVSLLQRYFSGELAAIDLEKWANAIESRDDIALEKKHSSLLKEFIYELANSHLEELLDFKRAKYWIDVLEGLVRK